MDFWIGALLLDYACFFYIGLLFHLTVFQEHLEDKHLSQILLGIEAFAFYAKLDSDPPLWTRCCKLIVVNILNRLYTEYIEVLNL
jgi:hypothetical protein